jgi:hypothetical protein
MTIENEDITSVLMLWAEVQEGSPSPSFWPHWRSLRRMLSGELSRHDYVQNIINTQTDRLKETGEEIRKFEANLDIKLKELRSAQAAKASWKGGDPYDVNYEVEKSERDVRSIEQSIKSKHERFQELTSYVEYLGKILSKVTPTNAVT